MDEIRILLYNIYEEIFRLNLLPDDTSIPVSGVFIEKISAKFGLIPFNVPELLKALENSRMIFSFDIVVENRMKRVRGLKGYVITKGDIIRSLKTIYSERFMELYTIEFNKKIPVEKALHDVFTRLNEYNNTPLGKLCYTAIGLEDCGKKLQSNILNYSEKNQQKLLEAEVERIRDMGFFVKEETADDAGDESRGKNRRSTDRTRFQELSAYTDKYSVEKTLAVYGINLYARICFREYQFSFIAQLIEDDIFKQADLRAIKNLLQSVRANSDRDQNLQNYAAEINRIQKALNNKIK